MSIRTSSPSRCTGRLNASPNCVNPRSASTSRRLGTMPNASLTTRSPMGPTLSVCQRPVGSARTRALAIGAHEFETHRWPQSLHVCGGALFPTWMPSMFRTTKGLTKKFRSKRLEDRARYRWARVQRCADGSMKFRCPQCSGRLVTDLTTHNGRKPNKSRTRHRCAAQRRVLQRTHHGSCQES